MRCHDLPVLDGKTMDGQIAPRVRVDCEYCHEHDQPLGVVTWAASGAIPNRVRELGDFEELPELDFCPSVEHRGEP